MQGTPPPITEPGKEKDPFGLNTNMESVAPNMSPSFMPGAPAPVAPIAPGGSGINQQDVINAMAARQAGGSIMDRMKPDWYRNLPNKMGPTIGTAMQAALDTGDKIAAMAPGPGDIGGAKGMTQAILGPVRTKLEKKVVSSLAKNAPELMGQIKRMPNTVDFKVGTPWVNPQASGIMEGGNLVPYNRVTIAPEVLRGRLPTAVQQAYPEFAKATGKTEMFANLPAVVAHEGQHAVNSANRNFQNLGTGEQSKMALATIQEMRRAPGDIAKQGAEQIGQSLSRSSKEAADEALAYLRQHQIARTRALLPLANEMLGMETKLKPMDQAELARQIMKKRMK